MAPRRSTPCAVLGALAFAAWLAVPSAPAASPAPEPALSPGDEAGSDAPLPAEAPATGGLAVPPAASRRTPDPEPVPAAGDDVADEEHAPDTRRVLPVQVAVVDAEGGHAVPSATWALGGAPADLGPDGRSVRVQPPDGVTLVTWAVAPAPSRLAWDPVEARVHVSRFATSLVAVYPLRRETDAEVAVLEEDGRAARAEGFEIVVTTAGRAWSVEPAFDAAGRLPIRGLPHFRGEPWTVTVCAKEGESSRTASAGGVLPYDAGVPLRARVVLPAEPDLADTLGLLGSGGCCGGCRFVTRCGPRADRHGRLAIRALRRDGTPAGGARLRVTPIDAPGARTLALDLDPAGRVEVDDLVPGRYQVATVEAGIVPFCAEVTVSAVAPAELELREPDGGDLELIAVDDDGRPLPFVRWEVQQPSGVAWVDLDGTVQRVDSWTDELGRRLLRHVEPGTVRVTASYGHRSARADAVVTEGRSTPLRLVLK